MVYELALHPSIHSALRDELYALATPATAPSTAPSPTMHRPRLTYRAVQDARLMDSFIREVLRAKGDTLNACRKAAREARLAGRRIPKGSLFLPMASCAHRSARYYEDPEEFKADRFVVREEEGEGGTRQAQAVALSAAYFPFGLGRWACPGRFLAVAGERFIFGCLCLTDVYIKS